MPEETPGAGKIRLTPPGSFVDKGALEKDLRKARAAEDKLKQAVEDQEEDRTEEQQREREAQIDRLLPDTVFSVFGDISFEGFKRMFSTVWDQVKDKTHLVRGYVTFETEVQPDLLIRIRTVRSGEMKALQALAPTPGAEFGDYAQGQMGSRDARVALSLLFFNDQELSDLGKDLIKKGAKEWMKDETVAERFDWIENLPEELVGAIGALVSDLTTAYRLAIQENLKNQLAPLSPSTG